LGLGVGLATLFLCYVAFFFGQTRCDAENNPHHPATCTLNGNQPTVLVPVAAYVSLAIFLFSLTPLPPKVMVALAGVVTSLYVVWALSVWVA
jgi:hypothetical protein